MKIEVFKNPLSNKVIATFTSKKDLLKWLDIHPNVFADSISINGQVLYGFDEL